MENPTINQMLNEADEKLFWAEDEFNKPAADIVGMCVCLNVKDVMNNYLKAFVSAKNLPPIEHPSLNDLLDECIDFDKDFKKIDLNLFMCKSEIIENNSKYCMSHEKTKECLEVARMTRDMVMNKIAS